MITNPSLPSFNTGEPPKLPDDIFPQIFLHLPADARDTMLKVCRAFRRIINYIPLDVYQFQSLATFSIRNDKTLLVKYMKIQIEFNKSVNNILSHNYEDLSLKEYLLDYIDDNVEAINLFLKDARISSGTCNYLFSVACVHEWVELEELLVKDIRVDPMNNKQLLQKICRNGHSEVVKLILSRFDIDSETANFALRNAAMGCEEGHVEVIKLLLNRPDIDPKTANFALQNAAMGCEEGHVEVIKLLLNRPDIDPSAYANAALKCACEFGHIELVKLLLAHPKMGYLANIDNEIFYKAINHIEIFKLLLSHPGMDPTVNDNELLRRASAGKKTETVKILLNDPRVIAANDKLTQKFNSTATVESLNDWRANSDIFNPLKWSNRSNLLKLTVIATAVLAMGLSIYNTYNKVEEQ